MLSAPKEKGQGLLELVVIAALALLVLVIVGQVLSLAAGGAEVVNALTNTMK